MIELVKTNQNMKFLAYAITAPIVNIIIEFYMIIQVGYILWVTPNYYLTHVIMFWFLTFSNSALTSYLSYQLLYSPLKKK